MKDLKDIRYHRSHRQDARIPEAKKYRGLAEKKRDPESIIEELEDILSETDYYILDLLAELKELITAKDKKMNIDKIYKPLDIDLDHITDATIENILDLEEKYKELLRENIEFTLMLESMPNSGYEKCIYNSKRILEKHTGLTWEELQEQSA